MSGLSQTKEAYGKKALLLPRHDSRMAGSSWWRYQKQVDVGSHIDNEDEVRMIAEEMAEFLLANQSEINEFLDLSGADWSWF